MVLLGTGEALVAERPVSLPPGLIIVADARKYLDTTHREANTVLAALPDSSPTPSGLRSRVHPYRPSRKASAEPKGDIDRALGTIKPDDLPTALAAEVERRAAEGDALAVDLLLSGRWARHSRFSGRPGCRCDTPARNHWGRTPITATSLAFTITEKRPI